MNAPASNHFPDKYAHTYSFFSQAWAPPPHIHIHTHTRAPTPKSPPSPSTKKKKICLIFSRYYQRLHSVEPPQWEVTDFQAQLDEKDPRLFADPPPMCLPFFVFKRDSMYPGRWYQCVWSLGEQVLGPRCGLLVIKRAPPR